MLSIKNISKQFNNKRILKNISTDVKKGEIALFLGSSGTGKSTLLRILNNLEKPDQGTITLNGTALTPTSCHEHIGMVFQQFNLFENLTVAQNIELALIKVQKKSPEQAHAIATELLQAYGMEDKAHKYPSQLSGGQKQRVAIMRAIALKPEVLCLDEPTSALDPLLTSSVAQTICDLASQGLIVLVATHDISLLKRLPCTIYLMEQGSISQYANSKEYEKNPAAYPKIDAFVKGNRE